MMKTITAIFIAFLLVPFAYAATATLEPGEQTTFGLFTLELLSIDRGQEAAVVDVIKNDESVKVVRLAPTESVIVDTLRLALIEASEDRTQATISFAERALSVIDQINPPESVNVQTQERVEVYVVNPGSKEESYTLNAQYSSRLESNDFQRTSTIQPGSTNVHSFRFIPLATGSARIDFDLVIDDVLLDTGEAIFTIKDISQTNVACALIQTTFEQFKQNIIQLRCSNPNIVQTTVDIEVQVGQDIAELRTTLSSQETQLVTVPLITNTVEPTATVSVFSTGGELLNRIREDVSFTQQLIAQDTVQSSNDQVQTVIIPAPQEELDPEVVAISQESPLLFTAGILILIVAVLAAAFIVRYIRK